MIRFDSDFYILEDEYEKNKIMYKVLIIYDITNNKRRRELKKILEGYGRRVQRSSFECYINEKMLNQLIRKSQLYIDKEEDSLRVYKLAGVSEIFTYGYDVKMIMEECIIV